MQQCPKAVAPECTTIGGQLWTIAFVLHLHSWCPRKRNQMSAFNFASNLVKRFTNTYKMLKTAYGEECMSYAQVPELFWQFKRWSNCIWRWRTIRMTTYQLEYKNSEKRPTTTNKRNFWQACISSMAHVRPFSLKTWAPRCGNHVWPRDNKRGSKGTSPVNCHKLDSQNWHVVNLFKRVTGN